MMSKVNDTAQQSLLDWKRKEDRGGNYQKDKQELDAQKPQVSNYAYHYKAEFFMPDLEHCTDRILYLLLEPVSSD